MMLSLGRHRNTPTSYPLTTLSRSQWSHWRCLGRRPPACSGVIGGVWEGGPVLFEGVGQQVKSSSGYPMAHRYLVQRISVAVQRKHCCSAREHWTEDEG